MGKSEVWNEMKCSDAAQKIIQIRIRSIRSVFPLINLFLNHSVEMFCLYKIRFPLNLNILNKLLNLTPCIEHTVLTYLCQDSNKLLERVQSFIFNHSVSSHLHTQGVVQRWLQVGHIHPGPGCRMTHAHGFTCLHNNEAVRRKSAFCSCLSKDLQGSFVLLARTSVGTGRGFPERTTPGSLWRA